MSWLVLSFNLPQEVWVQRLKLTVETYMVFAVGEDISDLELIRGDVDRILNACKDVDHACIFKVLLLQGLIFFK